MKNLLGPSTIPLAYEGTPMPSAKYIGYLGGAAVAAGVGAALAVAGQGTAYAEADGASSAESSSTRSESTSKTERTKPERTESKAADTESKTPEKDNAPDATDTDAGPKKRAAADDRAKFDPANAVKELTRQFGVKKPAEDEAEGTDETEATDETEPAASPAVFQPSGDLATKAAETAAALADPQDAAAGPVPWSPNPFRPMPPEPAPNDMPGLIWNVEQAVVNAFEPVPFLKPFVREGYEAGFRVSQMIPFVNAVIPIVNIADQLPNLATGDPVEFRAATQRIINNLIVTLHPVSVLYYAYDEAADLINLEYEAQQLKEVFYATTWNILDPFALLHNRGESGLPLSPSSPTSSAPPVAQFVKLAAAESNISVTTDDPGSSPIRADDPDPRGMPAALLDIRNFVTLLLPPDLKPVFREGFELVYRVSQVVPFVNAVVPITDILPALVQALGGDKDGAQRAVNQLLLTTGPVSFLYYGYDQIADLMNVEDAAFAAKEELYINLWDSIDSLGVLHNVGQSGLRAV